MKNFVQEGDVLHVTLSGTVASGDVVKAGSVIGVATTSGVSGDVIAVAVEGVFNVAKKSTDTPSQGAALYWDDTNKEMTTTSTSNTLAGYAWEAAGNGDTKVKVRLFL